MYISINQALNFWDQLVTAYLNENTYGGDVAEIYLYSMMEHRPTFAANPESKFCKDEVGRAKQAMRDLIKRFESTYLVKVMEALPIDSDEEEFGEVTLDGTHRYHLKVVRETEDVGD